ncbi:cholinesterase [Diaporthe helianthi]|uniref:Carboxylic ester hydrolase n=1 Tax=Diaporthe helianthi TaxID=158607 RepID=A0A2P5HE65_DIAHE|nr:cholinesterase [Diaporthe helianthi]
MVRSPSSFSSASAALLLALLAGAPSPAQAVDPTVSLDYSTYIGTPQSGTGVTEWLGIRYAAPPLGDLRFARPQDPPVVSTPQPANRHGKFCIGTGKPSNATDTSEDCLFLDIYAPSNATATSRLPVFFFIQGGGFNENSNANYNGTGLVKASGNNIIVVTFNYRVGPYGFLTNKEELQLNNGLYDQRKALEWVHEYISQFGGDPGHVVLGGDSAGAASITLQLAAFGGRDDGLFHAAAAESVSFATVLTVDESQYQYDSLALRLGCTGDTKSTLACLRSKPVAELQDANYNMAYPGAEAAPRFMYNPVIDGEFIHELTYSAFEEGNFVRVPIIVGDDTNGGTSFAPKTTATLAQSNVWMRNQFPYITPAQFADINALYPNQNETACPSAGCYFRQLSDTYGEMRYMCPGIYITAAYVNHGVPQSWHYRWNVEDPAQMASGDGVPHTVELNAIFGPDNTRGNAPDSYYPNGTNAYAVPVVQAYWTSFIRSYDPNTYRLDGTAEWLPWDDGSQQRILFDTGGVTSMESVAGSELMKRCEYWFGIGVDIRQKRSSLS